MSWRVAIIMYLVAGLLYQAIGYRSIDIFLFSFWMNVLFWPLMIFLNWIGTIILILIVGALVVFGLSRIYPSVGNFVSNTWVSFRKKVAL